MLLEENSPDYSAILTLSNEKQIEVMCYAIRTKKYLQ